MCIGVRVQRRFLFAGVVELVDTLDLGSSDRKVVGVQVPPPVPYEFDISK